MESQSKTCNDVSREEREIVASGLVPATMTWIRGMTTSTSCVMNGLFCWFVCFFLESNLHGATSNGTTRAKQYDQIKQGKGEANGWSEGVSNEGWDESRTLSSTYLVVLSSRNLVVKTFGFAFGKSENEKKWFFQIFSEDKLKVQNNPGINT